MKKNEVNQHFKVACVIVTYNNGNAVGKTLNRLFSQTYRLEEIVIVDNASPDGTASLIAKNYPKVTLFANQSNNGIGEGFSIGMEYAHKKKYDWIWLLDGDSTPEFNALEELIKAYSHPNLKNTKIGILASSPVNRKTSTRYSCAKWRGGRFVQIPIPESATDPIFVDIVYSSGSLINSKIIDEVGLPRVDFFIDFVDIEYDIRIMKKKYKIVLVPKSIIYHELGNTKIVRSITRLGAKSPSYVHSPWRLYYIVRNELYTFLHEFHDYKSVIFSVLRILIMIFYILIYNHDRKIQRLKYIFLGFRDGLKGRLGKVYGPEQ
jgi:GT2 family glycosyltransferase